MVGEAARGTCVTSPLILTFFQLVESRHPDCCQVLNHNGPNACRQATLQGRLGVLHISLPSLLAYLLVGKHGKDSNNWTIY